MPVSATLAINEETARRRAAGQKVLALGFGEAGLPVHPLLTAELTRAAPFAGYGPVAGIAELRAAAAGYWTRRGLPTDPAQVVAGPGSKALLWAILGTQSGAVVLPRPSWVSYAAQVALHHRPCLYVDTRDGQGGVPDPEQLDALAGRHAVSTVIVTLPDNPTGTLARPETVAALCAVAEEHDLLIVSDEIYRDLLHDPAAPFTSPAELAPGRTVVTAGLSKSLALGGWRIGIARFADDALRDQVVAIASEIWSAPPRPVQHAAVVGFDEPDEIRRHIAASRTLHARVAAAAAGILELPVPAGGFYLYPELAGAPTDEEIATDLLSRHGIAVLPGSAFGDHPGRGRVRIATSGLYGDTDEQRGQAFESEDPTTLPWIAENLHALRRLR